MTQLEKKLADLQECVRAARLRLEVALKAAYPEGTRVRYKTPGMKQWRTGTVSSTRVRAECTVAVLPDHTRPGHGGAPVSPRRVNSAFVQKLDTQ